MTLRFPNSFLTNIYEMSTVYQEIQIQQRKTRSPEDSKQANKITKTNLNNKRFYNVKIGKNT